MQLKLAQRGFSLVELAVTLAIVALLIGGAMATLSSQVETRNNDETARRLHAAADAIVAFAIVNRRLPCPARFAATHSSGLESFCTAATGTCSGSETTTVQTHGNCSNFYDGFVPAVSVGASPVDDTGFAVDAWGNRLRYAVARNKAGCTTSPGTNHVFTAEGNMRTYGVGCRPNDLDVCTTAACAARVVSQDTAVFVVFSTGKNGAITGAHGADEAENIDGDAVFVNRTPSGADSAGGTYDDLMVIVPVGVVYSKLISAGVLP
ncbi:MAG TPA: prepilin-type N-terminal cleavage/methylation domain-containing protein [Burkholderiales bacterium]|jgi:prepilin-type N-terminal cleavage/methylation domain-containing protein